MSKPTQWTSHNEQWQAVPPTVPELVPNTYRAVINMFGQPVLDEIKLVTDSLIAVNDSIVAKVIADVEKFWSMRERYESFKLLHKRGYLFEGPPGSGKTSLCNLIASAAVSKGSFALFVEDDFIYSISYLVKCIDMVRAVHPTTPILVFIEDIDQHWHEQSHRILALLDGETQTNNIVTLATTNYLSKLDSRLINRPSRFDEVIHVASPSEKTRRAYLHTLFPDIPTALVNRLAPATDGMMLAHVKELGVATHVLGQDPDTAITRLSATIEKATVIADEQQQYATVAYATIPMPKGKKAQPFKVAAKKA